MAPDRNSGPRLTAAGAPRKDFGYRRAPESAVPHRRARCVRSFSAAEFISPSPPPTSVFNGAQRLDRGLNEIDISSARTSHQHSHFSRNRVAQTKTTAPKFRI